MNGKRAWGLAVVAAVIFAACSGTSSSSPGSTGAASAGASASGGNYVVGFEGPLTGTVAADAVSRLDGIRGYFGKLNAAGGIAGHQVEVVARDDGGTDVAKATTNLTEFRTQIKPSIITGFTVSTIADAVAKLADEFQIPFIGSSASATAFANKFYYAASPLFYHDAAVQLNFIKSQAAAGTTPKVALFTVATPAGAAFKAEAERIAGAGGLTLVVNDVFPLPAPTDWLPQAQSAVDADAEWVVGTLFGPIPAAITKSLAQLGFTGRTIGNVSGCSVAILTNVNDPNYYCSSGLNLVDADTATIDAAVTAAGGDPAGINVKAGWYTAAVIAKALEKCGFPCDGPKAKAALDGIGDIGNPEKTALGNVKLSATDRMMVHQMGVFQFKDGKVSLVAPVDIETPAG